MKILAVIPARGGSKGIPRKNVRLMNGKPLIYYAIHNALSCPQITDVVVTSDDFELLSIAERFGAIPLERSAELSGDKVTLDPVIYDAVVKTEQQKGCRYDIVITMQATSPTLQTKTLSDAIDEFISGDFDTFISAVNKPHLSWTTDANGDFIPAYKERLNRQYLPPNYVEAGAFVISRRDDVKETGRIGKKVRVYGISETEAVDIDSIQDWVSCEALLGKKKILLRCDGYREIGMGHIFHCLTLYYNLTAHEVVFVTKKGTEGEKKLKERFVKLVSIENDEEFFAFAREYKPDIVVSDILDTTKEYMQTLKTLAQRVVSIEDIGEGAKYADAVINALYDGLPKKAENVYAGSDYVCLRDEFLYTEPAAFRPECKNILVLFGGTDPSNLTQKMYAVAKKLQTTYPCRFTFIAGIGYDANAHGIVSCDGIDVLRDISFMSEHIKAADLAVTSQGRTVYEIAAMGVPAIVMAQNERETLHTFASMKNGFMNLGLGVNVDDDTLYSTLNWLICTPQIREEMRNLMLKNNLKNGLVREIRIILGELL